MNISKVRKTQYAKQRILNKASELLSTYGFEYLTIRNICKAAGITTGGFYHYFRNKNELIMSFVYEVYEVYKQEFGNRWETLNEPCRIIDVFCYFAQCYANLGSGFISGLFNVKNEALNVRNQTASDENMRVAQDLIDQIETAQAKGIISSEVAAKDIYDELDMIFYGCAFDWCLSKSSFDLPAALKRMLVIHFNYYLADDYKIDVPAS